MPHQIPYDDKYLELCRHLGWLALTKQRGISPEASREFVKKLGDEHAIETIDMPIMKVVETHRLFCANSKDRAEMEKCASSHMKQLLRDLDYSNMAEGSQYDELLPVPSRENAQSILLQRFYDLVIADYKLPRIYDI